MSYRHTILILSAAVISMAPISCGSDDNEVEPPSGPTAVSEADYTVTASGLKYYDMEIGSGPMTQVGVTVDVHYTGWLTDGRLFDSSIPEGTPLSFVLGQGQVIQGWEEGLLAMQVGTRRQLVIPPDLAYGEAGAGNGAIPPNATLIFEVELLAIR
jgi:peptidylprolyl isomerase